MRDISSPLSESNNFRYQQIGGIIGRERLENWPSKTVHQRPLHIKFAKSSSVKQVREQCTAPSCRRIDGHTLDRTLIMRGIKAINASVVTVALHIGFCCGTFFPERKFRRKFSGSKISNKVITAIAIRPLDNRTCWRRHHDASHRAYSPGRKSRPRPCAIILQLSLRLTNK